MFVELHTSIHLISSVSHHSCCGENNYNPQNPTLFHPQQKRCFNNKSPNSWSETRGLSWTRAGGKWPSRATIITDSFCFCSFVLSGSFQVEHGGNLVSQTSPLTFGRSWSASLEQILTGHWAWNLTFQQLPTANVLTPRQVETVLRVFVSEYTNEFGNSQMFYRTLTQTLGARSRTRDSSPLIHTATCRKTPLLYSHSHLHLWSIQHEQWT